MFENVFDMVFVINLDERQDRWNDIVAVLEKVGFERYERISGIKKPLAEFPPEVYSGMSTDKLPFATVEHYLAGSCGCKMSHLKALQIARSRNYSSILILEDDCVFYPEFQKAFQKSWLWLKDVDWHMFYFGGNHRSRKKASHFKPGLLRIQCTYQSHAYAVSNNAYDFLIEKIESSGKEVDVIYAEDVHPVKKCFAIFPAVVGQSVGLSDIVNINCNNNKRKPNRKIIENKFLNYFKKYFRSKKIDKQLRS